MIYKSYIVEENFSLIKNKLVLFYGENSGLKIDFKNIIKFHEKNSEVISLSQEEIIKDENSFFKELFNYSLFGKKKVFLIESATDKILPLMKEIEKKVDNQKIFLFSEVLDKKSKLRNFFEKSDLTGVVPCYADTILSLNKIVNKKLKNYKNLNTININIIIENVNFDRSKLYNELDKIIIFFSDREIKTEQLRLLLNYEESDDFSELKDEALCGNKLKINKLISNTFIETDKNFLYLNLINQRLMKLKQICEMKKSNNLETAINSLKPPIFWKDKPLLLQQAKKWDLNKIKKTLNKTFEIEKTMKSNSHINTNILLKNLILNLCIMANS